MTSGFLYVTGDLSECVLEDRSKPVVITSIATSLLYKYRELPARG